MAFPDQWHLLVRGDGVVEYLAQADLQFGENTADEDVVFLVGAGKTRQVLPAKWFPSIRVNSCSIHWCRAVGAGLMANAWPATISHRWPSGHVR